MKVSSTGGNIPSFYCDFKPTRPGIISTTGAHWGACNHWERLWLVVWVGLDASGSDLLKWQQMGSSFITTGVSISMFYRGWMTIFQQQGSITGGCDTSLPITAYKTTPRNGFLLNWLLYPLVNSLRSSPKRWLLNQWPGSTATSTLLPKQGFV